MTKLQVFCYLSDALLLALYISFFAVLAGNLWFGIGAGILIVALRYYVNKALDKIKVKK